jgi:hypothetical protein
MSAEVDLAGLYPPNPSDPKSEWNEDIQWQPIPVHTQPSKIDNVTKFDFEIGALALRNVEIFNLDSSFRNFGCKRPVPDSRNS